MNMQMTIHSYYTTCRHQKKTLFTKKHEKHCSVCELLHFISPISLSEPLVHNEILITSLHLIWKRRKCFPHPPGRVARNHDSQRAQEQFAASGLNLVASHPVYAGLGKSSISNKSVKCMWLEPISDVQTCTTGSAKAVSGLMKSFKGNGRRG